MGLGTLDIVNPVSVRPAAGRALDCFFAPHSVAVVGATDKSGSVGPTVLQPPEGPLPGQGLCG